MRAPGGPHAHTVALDRNELGALLVEAGLGSPLEHALISLLVLNGLRVSEATGADIEHLGLERGHRTLTVMRKGGKVVTIRLAPRTARAIDLAIDERTGGPVFLTRTGGGWTGTAPGGSSAGSRAAPGSASRSRLTRSDTRSSSPRSMPGFRCAVQEAASHADPRTTMRYDWARGSLDRHATYIVAAYIAGAVR
jgi:integrase/recombinase XerD